MPVETVTFGCRLNLAESEAMRVRAEAAGFSDLVVVNSCAVTAEAVRRSRQAIRRLGRERPGTPILVTGCAAEIEPHAFAAMPQVARLVGNRDKASPATWAALARSDALARPAAEIAPADKLAPAWPGPEGPLAPQGLAAFAAHTRAFLQVQNGCDHRCTFCVIPFGRGRSRSLPAADVLDEARRLVEAGMCEIVLTGVDLTSYGADLPDAPTLGRLVRTLLAGVPELSRLRLSSIDAVEADDELLAAIAGEPRLMPHLHLSLQSGDDLVLKRMKRRHGRDDALRFCAELRRLRPGIVLGADLIAGFPTEDEAMFARSLALVEECGLTHVHAFPFSARPGTPAARMPQVPAGEVAERAARLRRAGEAALARHLAGQAGRRLAVLTERGDTGRCEDFTRVRFARPVAPGLLVEAETTGHDGRALLAA